MTTLIPKIDFMNGGVTPAGAVNRPINKKLYETVSVKDFGATGDGVTDDRTNDVFYAPQPYPSWLLNQNWLWEASVAYPTDGKQYEWDETIKNWVIV